MLSFFKGIFSLYIILISSYFFQYKYWRYRSLPFAFDSWYWKVNYKPKCTFLNVMSFVLDILFCFPSVFAGLHFYFDKYRWEFFYLSLELETSSIMGSCISPVLEINSHYIFIFSLCPFGILINLLLYFFSLPPCFLISLLYFPSLILSVTHSG